MLRWRKQPNERGLAGIVQGPRGFELRDGGKTVMHVAPKSGTHRWDTVGWYYYGEGSNTSDTPVATLEEAKRDALDYYKKKRAKRQI